MIPVSEPNLDSKIKFKVKFRSRTAASHLASKDSASRYDGVVGSASPG